MKAIDNKSRSRPGRPATALIRGWCLLLCMGGVHSMVVAGPSEEVVGRWKLRSHTVVAGGQSFDSHAALLQQRPCAEAIVYELSADQSFRLDASASACDEKYKSVQEKIYAKTKWKMEGQRITTSSTGFAVGQTYTVSLTADRMTWVGTEGQGTMVFQRAR